MKPELERRIYVTIMISSAAFMLLWLSVIIYWKYVGRLNPDRSILAYVGLPILLVAVFLLAYNNLRKMNQSAK